MTDRPLRVGVVGVGYLGGLHAAKYAALDSAELVGVCDSDRGRAAEVAAANGCAAFDAPAELAAAVDALSIAVPTAAHEAVAVAAIEGGVDVLVEKPLAATIAEAERIAGAAARHGRLLQIGHLERFHPALAEARQVVGRPRFIECHRLAPFAGRGADVSVVQDVMIHDLDLLASLVGEPVVSVEAIGVSVLSEHVDLANARLRFRGGCVANVTASRVSLKRERRLRVFQPEAYVAIDFDAHRLLVARLPEGAREAGGNPMESIELDQRDYDDADPLAEELAAFVAAVSTRGDVQVGPDEAIAAMRLATDIEEAIAEAAQDGA